MHMTLIRPKRSRLASFRGAAGYALLEAMVAVLIAAVGFIGAARMQTLGMSLGNSAQSRQKVHSKEQMRASRLDGGRSRSQHSQPGRSSSMAVFLL